LVRSVTPADVKAGPAWPADVTEVQDVPDDWCPRDKAFLLRRAAPERSVYVFNPRSTTIRGLGILDFEDARALIMNYLASLAVTCP
jgi:hypothetical protein